MLDVIGILGTCYEPRGSGPRAETVPTRMIRSTPSEFNSISTLVLHRPAVDGYLHRFRIKGRSITHVEYEFQAHLPAIGPSRYVRRTPHCSSTSFETTDIQVITRFTRLLQYFKDSRDTPNSHLLIPARPCPHVPRPT